MKYFLRTVYFYTLAFCLLKIILYNSISWGFIWIPYAVLITTFIIYFVIIWLVIYLTTAESKRNLKKHDFLLETSFFCSGCAKPLDSPIQHLKDETVYHKNCTPKTWHEEQEKEVSNKYNNYKF